MLQQNDLIKKIFRPAICSRVNATLWCKTEHALPAYLSFICSILPFYFHQHETVEMFMRFASEPVGVYKVCSNCLQKLCQTNTSNPLLFFRKVPVLTITKKWYLWLVSLYCYYFSYSSKWRRMQIGHILSVSSFFSSQIITSNQKCLMSIGKSVLFVKQRRSNH